jgi:branched-chain amino acid transport system permease protein
MLTKIKRNVLPSILILIAFSAPLIFISRAYMLLMFCIVGLYVISVTGLDILFGYSGQVSFGHAAFYGLGAYSTAILSRNYSVPPLLSMLIAIAITVIVAVLLALPAARLQRHFLSLLTTAFGMVFYLLAGNMTDLTGGFIGLSNIPRISIGAFRFDDYFKFYYLILLIAIVGLILKERIVRSRQGRAFIAIREDSLAASGSGINVSRYKVVAFAVSAAYMACAGALYAHMVGFISPDTFDRNRSIIFISMLILGGKGNFYGPIIGAVPVTFINQYFQFMGTYLDLLYGGVIVLVLMFMPRGISGSYRALITAMRHKLSKSAKKGNA